MTVGVWGYWNTGAVKVGKVGSATARLMSQRELVDFAVQWWT